MKSLFLAVVLTLSSCTGLERDVNLTKDQLTLIATKAKIQTLELEMCKERAAHSIRCDRNCKISAAWHKQKWNK